MAYLKTGISKRCKICGKEFFTIPSRIKKGLGKFCSKECFWEYQRKSGLWRPPSWLGRRFSKEHIEKLRKVNTGKNNPYWKGGISSVKHRIEGTFKYREWRQKVFLRDNFTCQECGQWGGKLNAHHKISFCKLLREALKALPLFSPDEAAMLYTPLWDIDNGITYCKDCHRKRHSERHKKRNRRFKWQLIGEV